MKVNCKQGHGHTLWQDEGHTPYCYIWGPRISKDRTKKLFTKSPQYKNAHIVNFVLAVPLEMNNNNEFCNIQM